jgi:hypothetical protein
LKNKIGTESLNSSPVPMNQKGYSRLECFYMIRMLVATTMSITTAAIAAKDIARIITVRVIDSARLMKEENT